MEIFHRDGSGYDAPAPHHRVPTGHPPLAASYVLSTASFTPKLRALSGSPRQLAG
ncbi:hypothetical protein [Sphingopyxis sp.]|uniref:hypothetical protein n=1 Tax=Sphingopyxis sp. TaxID=1908224 RepID=UPI001D761FC8|nr:hypothetical protein [Sphingopyxis sp.]MBW8295858.1 hypothetical protein [Sphingopyxis sp.]